MVEWKAASLDEQTVEETVALSAHRVEIILAAMKAGLRVGETVYQRVE